MPIDDRALPPGTVLVGRYKGKQRRCTVVDTPDGLRYQLDDGSEHQSPSGAARAVAGGVARNGWRFWSLDQTPRSRPGRKPARVAAHTKRSRKKKA
jgi:hypothetical protein